MNARFFRRLDRAYRSVARQCRFRPPVGIITGSGLSGILGRLVGIEIPYKNISCFPRPTVKGHPGIFKVTPRVAVCGGRFHAYEGFSPEEIVFPVFLLHRLGVKKLVLTNAAGGIRNDLEPGRIVIIRDHLNLTGLNPLRGRFPAEYGPRFTDMTDAYSSFLREKIRQRFSDFPEGIYAGLLGPSYETPAEIRMLEALGADLVGMSTVLETIAARFLGLEVVGLSLVTNKAAGKTLRPLSHEEVIDTGVRAGERLSETLLKLIDLLSDI